MKKVALFLEEYHRAKEWRVAWETETMLLDQLVKEGLRRLDQLLAVLVREGKNSSYANGDMGIVEQNGALARYLLEEVTREQEKRAMREAWSGNKVDDGNGRNPQSPNKKEVNLV